MTTRRTHVRTERQTMDYTSQMKQIATRRFDELFRGIDELVLVDFPDHPNVGDSAIAVGELDYFAERGVRVRAVYCIGTLQRAVLRSRTPVAHHGGGNIAGFFEQIDRHRLRVVRGLRPSTLLVQAPQSIHFKTPAARQELVSAFAARSRLRVAVRDATAVEVLRDELPDVLLVPDAVHLIGHVPAPAPRQHVLVLARRDGESGRGTRSELGADWPRDEPDLRRDTWWRWKARFMGPAGALLNPSPEAWRRIAERRLARGVQLLSAGEVVVTDRLHAMLLALQMGRRVVAIDNNNQKLSKYARTWFTGTRAPVTFAPDFESALDLAEAA